MLAWLLPAIVVVTPPTTTGQPDLVLSGLVTGQDHQRYLTIPFDVPERIQSFTISFSYDRANRTVIDLGLLEGDRLRGWSGGNKSQVTVGETAATPSYLPGPVAGKQFKLLLGVPNARVGSKSAWRAEIRFHMSGEAIRGVVLNAAPGWYRGDFHTHSGHSDGTCAVGNTRIPCPVHRTVDAAVKAGLDFVAVTDHNTVSHFGELEALQPAYPRLLLIPGQEITTFHGHANVLGTQERVPFQIGGAEAPDSTAWSRRARATGGVVSINHPGLPSGEACMGCGWKLSQVDWSSIDAVEIANGGAIAASGGKADGPLSGIRFWQQKLEEGLRIAPVAGSDNHDPELAAPDPRAIGRVTSVVWADELSVTGISEGVRRGRLFIDLENQPGRTADLWAVTSGDRIAMGSVGSVPVGSPVVFELQLTGCEQCSASLVIDGERSALRSSPAGTLKSKPIQMPPFRTSWAHAEIRAGDGRLLLVTNAIHLRAKD